MTYLPDNQDLEKRGGSIELNLFVFLTLKMDSLAQKMTAHDVCFSVWAVKDLFSDPLMESMEKELVRKLHSNVKWCYLFHLSPVQLHLRLKPSNSTSQPAEAVDHKIIPAQFRPSLEARRTFLFCLFNKYIDSLRATTSIHFEHLGKNEWLRGSRRRIRILLGVVVSIQHISEQIGQAGPEGQLVLGDAVLCFLEARASLESGL